MSVGAAAVVFDEAGRVLVVKENYGKHRYSLPGGSLEPGELPEEAAVRETYEETGTEVRVVDHVGVYRIDDGFEAHAFRCEIVSGTPALPPTDELSEVAWYHPDSIPQPHSNILHYALPDALSGARDVVRDVARVS